MKFSEKFTVPAIEVRSHYALEDDPAENPEKHHQRHEHDDDDRCLNFGFVHNSGAVNANPRELKQLVRLTGFDGDVCPGIAQRIGDDQKQCIRRLQSADERHLEDGVRLGERDSGD